MPRSVPADTVGGRAYAVGRISGNIHEFDLRARAAGEDVAIRGNFARRFRSEIAWTNARTPRSNLAFGFDGDSIMAMGFALDSVQARVSYAAPNGHADIVLRQGDARDYAASGDFTLAASGNALRLSTLRLRLDTAVWVAPHATEVHWGGPGIRVVNFELRNRSNGRVWANGLLPTEGVANFDLAVDNFPVGNVVDLLQSDLALTGTADLSGRMSGTLRDPTFNGAFALLNGVYNGTALPLLRGRFGYADRQLVSHLEAFRDNGAAMAVADARLPINLALSGVTGKRLLDAPMEAQITADSLPVDLIPHLTDVVSDVRGHVAGRVAMRGRIQRPSLVGAVVIAQGSATINATGARIEEIRGHIRMANDTVFVDSLRGRSHGDVRLAGTVAVGNWREPSFELFLAGSDFELLDNDFGKIRANMGLALTGPWARPYLSGEITIEEGVIRAPEPTGKHVIGAGDPALFNVIDTSLTVERALFPTRPPFYKNARVEVGIEVRRNTWVRTRDANIEVFTEYPVRVEMRNERFSVIGVVTTDRGQYNFMSTRFEVRRGSAVFVGGQDVNPTLQVTADYEVQLPSAPAMNIKVVIGGTLRRPRLTLESDIQPPRSQSELLSLLAFGRSTTSLLAGGSSISGAPTGADLFGLGARLAMKRLTGVALGVMVDEIESEAGKAFGTDYMNITPADVPPERLASGSGIGDLFTQTRIEAGKYLNPRLFLGVQTVGASPGIRVEYRQENGWRFEGNMEPRILLLEPSLSGQVFRTRQAYGAFILREWRF
jgi:autotransporter translocation and assembly factor TamB